MGGGSVGVALDVVVEFLDKLEDMIECTDEESDREEMTYDALLKHTAGATQLGIKTVDTLVKGIIFEPTNYRNILEG